MIFIGLATIALFAIGWLVAVASWFYAAYHTVMWFFRRGKDGGSLHGSKAIRGGIAFLAGWAFGFFNGLIGIWLGGWQQIADGRF
jgi:hypothetical protein